MNVQVAVNGYGVIGKRVADAVRDMPDMDLVGVADIATDWHVRTAAGLGIPVFAATQETRAAMLSAGVPVAGTLDELLAQADVVVDTTPKKVAATNLEVYRSAGVRAVFQGGESHATTGHSFVAQANYATALGRDTTRVVSCNTTSIVRVLGALQDAGLLARARGVLIRRATDPGQSPPARDHEHRGPRGFHSLPPGPRRPYRPAGAGRGHHGRQGGPHPDPQPLLDAAVDPPGQPGRGPGRAARRTQDRVHPHGRRPDRVEHHRRAHGRPGPAPR